MNRFFRKGKDILSFNDDNSDRNEIVLIPVNCVGVMGAGLAKQFADQYPKLYRQYKDLCNFNAVGKYTAHILEDKDTGRFFCMFPTKYSFREKSDLDLIKTCLIALQEALEGLPEGMAVRIPKLGCGLGGLDWEQTVLPVLKQWMDELPETIKENISFYVYIE